MVSSQMPWQAMQACTQSCISLLMAVIVPGWFMVMALLLGVMGPGAGPVPYRGTPGGHLAPSGGRERSAPHAAPAGRRKPPEASGGFRRRYAVRLSATASRYGRLRAITMRWTWLVPS
ncbi:hypothetical protein GCM10023335_85070 [Streptomyces siamensis]|uniref:Uncharacterized protein n=1 Tax=Streptomyces siamensis TaxID=1274986 RepID=A0ABP9JMW4_9ACTN